MYKNDLKKQIEIFFKSNDTTIAQTAKRFNIPYTTLKTWVDNEGWEAGSALKNIDTTSNEVVTQNFDLITNKTKDSIKKEIISNLGTLSSDVDSIVLNSLITQSAESVLMQAMSLNHINKSLALNASIAKNALMEMLANADDKIESKMAIIACSEKVSKIFNDLKTSLYGKDITISHSINKDVKDMSEEELLEILNTPDE